MSKKILILSMLIFGNGVTANASIQSKTVIDAYVTSFDKKYINLYDKGARYKTLKSNVIKGKVQSGQRVTVALDVRNPDWGLKKK